MLKKISAALLALSLCTVMLAGCAGKEDKNKTQESSSAAAESETESQAEETVQVEEPSLTVDGKPVDVSNYVMCTIGDHEVTFEEFRFYYYYTLDLYERNYGMTLENICETNESYRDFLEAVVVAIKQEVLTGQLAADNDIELDEEDMKSVQENIDKAKSNYENEEAYQQALLESYLTEDLYRLMMERAQTYAKVMSTLFSNEGKYATKYEDFKKIIQDEEQYAREIHIMIPAYSQAALDESSAEGYDDMTLSQKIGAKQTAYSALDDAGKAECRDKAKALADEVMEKAKNGDDFIALLEEYGWDYGLEDPTAGYYIYKDNTEGYPQALIDEAFSLKPGEMSEEPVEIGDYGFFIVKRLEPDMDYVEENIAELTNTYDEPFTQQKLAELMEEIEVTYCADWDKFTAGCLT